MILKSIKIILLPDRDFDRCALAAFRRWQHFRYLIRIGLKVCVKHKGLAGNLRDYPAFKGTSPVFKDVACRSPLSNNIGWQAGPERKAPCGIVLEVRTLFHDMPMPRACQGLHPLQVVANERLAIEHDREKMNGEHAEFQSC